MYAKRFFVTRFGNVVFIFHILLEYEKRMPFSEPHILLLRIVCCQYNTACYGGLNKEYSHDNYDNHNKNHNYDNYVNRDHTGTDNIFLN